MRLRKITSFSAAMLVSLSSLAVLAPSVHAAVDVCTWTGATNDNFNTAGNWNCATDGATAIPGTGDSLVFDNTSLSANKTLTNDIPSGISVNTITFQGSGNKAFTIAGNDITVVGGITASAGFPTIKTNITLGGSQVFSGGFEIGDYSGSTTLNLASYNLNFGLASDPVNSFYVASAISGAGTMTVDSGSLYLQKDNTFTGNLVVNKGSLLVYTVNGLGTTAGSTSIADGSGIVFCTLTNPASDFTFNEAISLAAGRDSYGQPVLSAGQCGIGGGGGPTETQPDKVTLAGALTIGADTVVGTNGTVTITGAITGNHTLKLEDGYVGKLVINSSANGSATPNGTGVGARKETKYESNNPASLITVYSHETAVVTGKYGDTSVLGDGILKGTGTVGKLILNDKAVVAPGMSPGCLSSGDLTMVSGTSYQAELGGTDACSLYDQLKVTGTVNITDSNLVTSLYGGFKPKKGDSFMIIDNDTAADAVTGTFKDLAEGATFTVDGYVFKISYKGGDGNDVVLNVQSVPGAPNTGFNVLTANPFVTLLVTSTAAGALLVATKRSGRLLARR